MYILGPIAHCVPRFWTVEAMGEQPAATSRSISVYGRQDMIC